MVSCTSRQAHTHKKLAQIKTVSFHSNAKIPRVPFDWKTPSGFLVMMILQSILGAYHFFLSSTITTFGIAIYLFLHSAIEDIKANFDSTTYKRPNMRKRTTTRIRSVKQLCEFVELHSDSKQLSRTLCWNSNQIKILFSGFVPFRFRLVREFSDIYYPILLTVFSCSFVTICGSMLMIQLEIV